MARFNKTSLALELAMLLHS